eukprot:8135201-Prorocentrum_lima.AAC.1
MSWPTAAKARPLMAAAVATAALPAVAAAAPALVRRPLGERRRRVCGSPPPGVTATSTRPRVRTGTDSARTSGGPHRHPFRGRAIPHPLRGRALPPRVPLLRRVRRRSR